MTSPRALEVAPAAPLGFPRRGSAVTRRVASWLFRAMGWRFEGAMPELPQCVLIVAPHTSNWDFPVGIVAKFAIGFRATFLAKHTLFAWPMGPILRWLGGEPVDRTARHGVVSQVLARFQAEPQYILVIAPEGTRKAAPWKLGFYHIARGANVPILPVAFDWPRRIVHFHPPMQPTGDETADRAALRACFSAAMARHPEDYRDP